MYFKLLINKLILFNKILKYIYIQITFAFYKIFIIFILYL